MRLFVFSKVLRSDECGKTEDEENVKPDEKDQFVSCFPFVDFLFSLSLFFGFLNYLDLAVIHMEIV
jgi:hypothetical protein